MTDLLMMLGSSRDRPCGLNHHMGIAARPLTMKVS